MPAWLLPTARATSWAPLYAVAAALTATALVSRYTDRWVPAAAGVLAAALAAAVVAGLRDPAAALLAAVPTSAATRHARRLLLLLPAGLAAWLACGRSGDLGALVALTATGLAVAAWAGVGVGVAAPMVWAGVSRASADLDGRGAEALVAWEHHPWVMTVAAGAALLLGRHR